MQKFILFFVLLITSFSHSAIVLKSKANKCLIHLEGEEAFPGDKFFALNLAGEKVGIVEIEKAKNGKAIGRILQGIAESNWILEKTSQTNPVLESKKNSVTLTSSLSNSIGISLVGTYSQLIQENIRGTQAMSSFNSLSGGGVLFTNFKLSSLFMIHLQAGGEYINLRESTRTPAQGSRRFNFTNLNQDRRSSFLVWSVPITLQYYIPMNSKNTKIWLGFGFSLDYWGSEFEQSYDILQRESAYNKLSNSAHAAFGVDFYPPRSPFFIPIRVQGTNHFFLDFIQRTVLGDEDTNLSFNQFSIYIGIARNI